MLCMFTVSYNCHINIFNNVHDSCEVKVDINLELYGFKF